MFGMIQSEAEARCGKAEKGARGEGRQFRPPLNNIEIRRVSARRLISALLAHGIAFHFDAMCVVDQAIEDAIGDRRIADLPMPTGDRQL